MSFWEIVDFWYRANMAAAGLFIVAIVFCYLMLVCVILPDE